MKQIIENVIKYKLAVGQSKEEVLSGMYHTLCESLELSHAEGLSIIRRSDDQKAISDTILKSYQPDHEGLKYNKLTGSRVGRSYPKSPQKVVSLTGYEH